MSKKPTKPTRVISKKEKQNQQEKNLWFKRTDQISLSTDTQESIKQNNQKQQKKEYLAKQANLIIKMSSSDPNSNYNQDEYSLERYEGNEDFASNNILCLLETTEKLKTLQEQNLIPEKYPFNPILKQEYEQCEKLHTDLCLITLKPILESLPAEAPPQENNLFIIPFQDVRKFKEFKNNIYIIFSNGSYLQLINPAKKSIDILKTMTMEEIQASFHNNSKDFSFLQNLEGNVYTILSTLNDNPNKLDQLYELINIPAYKVFFIAKYFLLWVLRINDLNIDNSNDINQINIEIVANIKILKQIIEKITNDLLNMELDQWEVFFVPDILKDFNTSINLNKEHLFFIFMYPDYENFLEKNNPNAKKTVPMLFINYSFVIKKILMSPELQKSADNLKHMIEKPNFETYLKQLQYINNIVVFFFNYLINPNHPEIKKIKLVQVFSNYESQDHKKLQNSLKEIKKSIQEQLAKEKKNILNKPKPQTQEEKKMLQPKPAQEITNPLKKVTNWFCSNYASITKKDNNPLIQQEDEKENTIIDIGNSFFETPRPINLSESNFEIIIPKQNSKSQNQNLELQTQQSGNKDQNLEQ